MKKIETSNLVIGAGSGGLTVAIGLQGLGKATTLVSKNLGGDCTHYGCVPSKALIHAAKVGKSGREAFSYLSRVVDGILDEDEMLVTSAKHLTYISGTAQFVAPDTVEIVSSSISPTSSRRESNLPTMGAKRLRVTAKHIVIATGSTARRLIIPGLPENLCFTNENFFNLKDVPSKLVVYGAGPIGCELAQACALLGSEVHLIYRKQGILSNDEPELSEFVLEQMKQDGVIFHWNIPEVEYKNKNLIDVKTGNTVVTQPDAVLIAIGRVPTLDLDLDKAGITYTDHGIEVNHRYQTSQKNVYAIGDCISEPKFTHLANAQGRSVVKSLGVPIISGDHVDFVPAVTYTAPEIGSVGINLRELKQLDSASYKKIEVPFQAVDRGKIDQSQGKLLIYASRCSGIIIRAAVVGDNAGDLVTALEILVEQKISLWKVSNLVLPFPTLGQVIKKAGDIFVVETLSNLKEEVSVYCLDLLKTYGPKLAAIIFWISILIGTRVWMAQSETNFSQLGEQLTLVMYSPMGVGIYVLVYFFRSVIFFPATILTLIAGSVWGVPFGFVVAWLSGTLSSVLPFFVGRWYTGSKATPTSGMLGAISQKISQNTFSSVLLMRLLYLPYDAASLVAGAAKASPVGFFLATLLGNIAGTLTFVTLGASVEADLRGAGLSLNPKLIIFSITLFVVGIGVSKLVKSHTSSKE